METEVLIALIGVMGVIFGALMTGIIQYISSKQKLDELRISYSQKTYEKLIESARNHLDDLYLPLYQEISSLLYHYTKYRNITKIRKKSGELQQLDKEFDEFVVSILKFDDKVETIFNNGKTAYLIGTIEDRLIDLRDLLDQSRKEPSGITQVKVTSTIGVSIFGMNMSKTITTTEKTPLSNLPKYLEILTPGTIKTTFETKLLKAPLDSEDFEEQFIEYIIEIKRNMKEVMLWLKNS